MEIYKRFCSSWQKIGSHSARERSNTDRIAIHFSWSNFVSLIHFSAVRYFQANGSNIFRCLWAFLTLIIRRFSNILFFPVIVVEYFIFMDKNHLEHEHYFKCSCSYNLNFAFRVFLIVHFLFKTQCFKAERRKILQTWIKREMAKMWTVLVINNWYLNSTLSWNIFHLFSILLLL